MKSATLQFPRPFSLNNKDANTSAGRVKTAAYRRWSEQAAQMIMAQGPRPRFVGPVNIEIEAGEIGVSPLFDLDNAIKPILDVLVDMGVIPDDRRAYVKQILARWECAEGCQVTINGE